MVLQTLPPDERMELRQAELYFRRHPEYLAEVIPDDGDVESEVPESLLRHVAKSSSICLLRCRGSCADKISQTIKKTTSKCKVFRCGNGLQRNTNVKSTHLSRLFDWRDRLRVS